MVKVPATVELRNDVCPQDCLAVAHVFNRQGYHYAQLADDKPHPFH